MATAKIQRKAVKPVPVKKFNMKNGEPVEIKMTRKARKESVDLINHPAIGIWSDMTESTEDMVARLRGRKP
ncbi:MAG: hypothetical protein LBP68_02345 [Acidobacteriota bacterium]|nr:hypothetical protein [Acidobacteriota bacterium]